MPIASALETSPEKIPEAVQSVVSEALKRGEVKAKLEQRSSSSSRNSTAASPPPATTASAKSLGKDRWKITCGTLPIGSIVKARINEAKDPKMQESYMARVVRAWPTESKLDPRRSSSSQPSETELVALNFIDPKIASLLPKQRKGKPPPTHYVEPNDVEECRVTLKPAMIANGHVNPGTKVSIRYFFQGKRVRGWMGYYPATVTEHCEDGTVLIKYMHEEPDHEEYLHCKDVQFAPLR